MIFFLNKKILNRQRLRVLFYAILGTFYFLICDSFLSRQMCPDVYADSFSSAPNDPNGQSGKKKFPSLPFDKNVSKKEEGPSPVELNGDQIEFAREGSKLIADGHVVMIKGDTRLTCDHVEFSRATKMTHARGHVVLSSPQGKISGDEMTYNFEKMTGEFQGARIITDPYYGAAPQVSKVDDQHIRMSHGYLTTCDHDKPHFRFLSKKLDVYPGDKVVARGVRMMVGPVPLFYLPRFTQTLDDRKPRVFYTPGYDKNWGAFLLQDWRLYLSDHVKGHLHLDYREKKAFAPGLDLSYKTPNKGEGLIRLYYMDELTPQRRHFWKMKTGKTVARERFRAQWRHKWTIDDKTQAVWQYYNLKDPTFLKDYFKREYAKDQTPLTFFLLTHTFKTGTLSFDIEKRVNRYNAQVERLPEIRYDLSNQKLGSTNFYLKSVNTYSNLSSKDASPTEVRKETMRVDSDNQLAYLMKVSFVELRPFVGERETYYSKTQDTARYGVIRSIFSTGADLSTKFYKIYDVQKKFWGIDIHRLRHIVTPTINYSYLHTPTVSSSILDTFDSVDSITRDHIVGLGLENKLQTKRGGKIVDLLRVLWSSNFNLKEHIGHGSFDEVKSNIEFKPTDWLRFDSDSDYDPYRHLLSSANFDIYVNDKDKWALGFGKRYSVDADDQITTDFSWRINPKWMIHIYDRFDINHGQQKEQEFTITRDLHEWEMDLNFNETRGQGSEIWLVFRLKAFPDMKLDLFGTSFNRRKAGSQSWEGQSP